MGISNEILRKNQQSKFIPKGMKIFILRNFFSRVILEPFDPSRFNLPGQQLGEWFKRVFSLHFIYYGINAWATNHAFYHIEISYFISCKFSLRFSHNLFCKYYVGNLKLQFTLERKISELLMKLKKGVSFTILLDKAVFLSAWDKYNCLGFISVSWSFS